MGCSDGLARILVFVSNFAFLLVGLALLIVGVLYKVNFTKYTDAIPSEYGAIQHVPTLAIIIGAIIFVIAFLGCCGALKTNTCMLSWYGALLILIFILQVALGIFAFIKIKDKDDFDNQIASTLNIVFPKYSSDADGSIKETVDFIQQHAKCCGTTSPLSWASWDIPIPDSCYPDNEPLNIAYLTGCNTAFPEYLMKAVKTVAIVALSISAVEIVGAILALCLVGCIRESRRQGAFY